MKGKRDFKPQGSQYEYFKNVVLDENGCLCVAGIDDLVNKKPDYSQIIDAIDSFCPWHPLLQP